MCSSGSFGSFTCTCCRLRANLCVLLRLKSGPSVCSSSAALRFRLAVALVRVPDPLVFVLLVSRFQAALDANFQHWFAELESFGIGFAPCHVNMVWFVLDRLRVRVVFWRSLKCVLRCKPQHYAATFAVIAKTHEQQYPAMLSSALTFHCTLVS